eukprot:Hpha_TRINITY_DN20430_c0_g1::TRINITY_DN20430_c0_g1_i1::g.64141::m.64141
MRRVSAGSRAARRSGAHFLRAFLGQACVRRGPQGNIEQRRVFHSDDPSEALRPAVHLPTYFELREIGMNYRYRSDPEWVVDIIMRDCTREEGLTYVPSASTYSVTFFQLINYCARRGYQMISFGMVDGGARSGRRYAVLYNGDVDNATRMHPNLGPVDDTPPTRFVEGGVQSESGAEQNKDERLVKWGSQSPPPERKLKREEFAFYDNYTPGRVGRFDSPEEFPTAEVVDPEIISMEESRARVIGEDVVDQSTVQNRTEELRERFSGEFDAPHGKRPVEVGEDLRLRLNKDDANTRGI